MARELQPGNPAFQTEAATSMEHRSAVSGAEPLGLANDTASVEEQLPPGYDKYYLSELDRQELGIKPDEDYGWVRNPQVWQRHEGNDRGMEYRRTNLGAGRVVLQNGVPYCMEDLILVARPRVISEQVAARDQREESAYYRHLADTQEHILDDSPTARMDRRDRTRRFGMDNGYIGPMSDTHGVPYERAIARKTEAQIDADEERARRGGRTATANEEQQVADLRERAGRGAAGAQRSSGKVVSGSTAAFREKAGFLKGPAREANR